MSEETTIAIAWLRRMSEDHGPPGMSEADAEWQREHARAALRAVDALVAIRDALGDRATYMVGYNPDHGELTRPCTPEELVSCVEALIDDEREARVAGVKRAARLVLRWCDTGKGDAMTAQEKADAILALADPPRRGWSVSDERDALARLAAIVMERGDLTEGQLTQITGLPRLALREIQDDGAVLLDASDDVRPEWRQPVRPEWRQPVRP